MTHRVKNNIYTRRRKRSIAWLCHRKDRGVTGQSDECSKDADEHPSVKLSDQSVLDCPICFRSLTVPVFQCANGHISCSSCHPKLKDKCPTCSMILGNIRNRAIESVLESLKISCSYKVNGCSEMVVCCDKRSHEDACVYAPYTCPFTDCNFRGLPRSLYFHLKEQHKSAVFLMSGSGSHFECLQFTLGKSDNFVVFLREEYRSFHSSIFILHVKDRRLRISTIQEPNHYSKGCNFRYMLSARHDCGCFKFESVTVPLLRDADVVNEEAAGSNCLSGDFLPLLGYFFGADGSITLELMIWDDDYGRLM